MFQEKRPCASCGELVPERQDPPFHGHAKKCAFVERWRTFNAGVKKLIDAGRLR